MNTKRRITTEVQKWMDNPKQFDENDNALMQLYYNKVVISDASFDEAVDISDAFDAILNFNPTTLTTPNKDYETEIKNKTSKIR